MRYFIQFSYYGKAYHGWQNQPNAITVQAVLEETMSTFLRRPIGLVGAGRTDAGVHAKQMYAHFEFDGIDTSQEYIYRINSFLPDTIAVQKIWEVPKDAHARFSAVERTYEYWVVQEKNPFYIDAAYYVKNQLDVDKMNQAATLLLTYDDFECFSKSGTDVNTFICDIRKAEWTIKEDKLVFTITANRFLRNMVRAIVGTLLDVGVGKFSIDDVKAIINSKDRSKAGMSVPAKGLYLTSVLYPENFFQKD